MISALPNSGSLGRIDCCYRQIARNVRCWLEAQILFGWGTVGNYKKNWVRGRTLWRTKLTKRIDEIILDDIS